MLGDVLRALGEAVPARIEVREHMGAPSRYVYLDGRWERIGPMAFVTANGVRLLEHALREEIEARGWTWGVKQFPWGKHAEVCRPEVIEPFFGEDDDHAATALACALLRALEGEK